jgi:hypothetical protein
MPGTVKLIESNGKSAKILQTRVYKDSKEVRSVFENLNDFVAKNKKPGKVYYFSIKTL